MRSHRQSRTRLIFTLLALTVALLAIAACGGEATPAPMATVPAAEAPATEAPTAEAPAAEAPAVEAPATEAAPAEQSAAAASAGAITFQITPGAAEARFLIDEVLMGQDKTVVGVTQQVSGDLTVDPANPAAAQIGEIRIDARDLTTDDDRRTNQLRRNILRSGQDQYQYITFRPTSLSGMPAAVAVGETFTFQVTGDLTIIDTTLPVTFDMTVTPVAENTLQGSGAATVRYADFGISIPSVPFVAGVQDDVRLEIDFTAAAS
jgi:polyisoprenoid-binding protein YceI